MDDGTCRRSAAHSLVVALHHHVQQAVAYLTKAISCKYTAVNSVLALKQLYDNIRLLSRTEPEMWENWAVILEKHVNRTEEAALMYAEIGNVYLLRSVNLDSNLLATLVTDGDAKIVPPAGTNECLLP